VEMVEMEFHLQSLVLQLQGLAEAAAELMLTEAAQLLVVQVKQAAVTADITIVVVPGRVQMPMLIQVLAAVEVLGLVALYRLVMEAQE